MRKFLFIASIFLNPICINAQDHFLVELEKFSPPEKDIINTLRGFPAESFLALDVANEEHFLGNYKGIAVIIWFWNTQDSLSFSWLTSMNLLQLQYLDEIKLFGFSTDSREKLTEVAKNNALIFPNFPNSSVFGDAAYGGDLGSGRMFFIDIHGIIKEVLPRSFFNIEKNTTAIERIEMIIKHLID